MKTNNNKPRALMPMMIDISPWKTHLLIGLGADDAEVCKRPSLASKSLSSTDWCDVG
jgi:hypothetical protein